MRVAAWMFGVAYLVALGLFAISFWGLLGQSEDPLGGVFLLPLGLPWNLMLDRLTGMSSTALLVAPRRDPGNPDLTRASVAAPEQVRRNAADVSDSRIHSEFTRRSGVR
ncbi:hypothetical protein V6R86_02770 [Sphingomonas kaistensis]|uniref:Uncharacterized protein n=1 Tax=Sphingomonas kaistensis TaxID=298708 RepID=A0ABZ2FXT9_9SPHN